MKHKILIVEDELNQNEILKTILSSEGYIVKSCIKGSDAPALYKEFKPALVLTDLKLTDTDGIQLMRRLKESGLNAEFIIITAYGSITSAVEAIREGAFDYIPKPIDREKLLISVRNALDRYELKTENIVLKEQLRGVSSIDGIIGKSEAINNVLKLIRTVATHDITVLIVGETGTGKGLVARAIHNLSARKDGPFVVVNTPAIPESLFESELFGYERGAFTGAYTSKEGLIELAEGGTLFLDEIAEVPLPIQAKLLRFIEEKKFRRIGGKEERTVNARLLAATNRDLEEEIKKMKFRDDLYYRLSGFTIKIPPLRDRITDVEPLARYFLKKYNLLHKRDVKGINEDALRILFDYHWPGNVRELESVIEKAVLITEGEVIRKEDILLPHKRENNKSTFELPPEGIVWDDFEKEILLQAMKRSGNNITRAAKLLGITFRTMQYRLKKYGITFNHKNTPDGL